MCLRLLHKIDRRAAGLGSALAVPIFAFFFALTARGAQAGLAPESEQAQFARLQGRAEERSEDFWRRVEAALARERSRLESRREWLESLERRETVREQARREYAARPKESFEASRLEMERQREQEEEARPARRERERADYARARDRLRDWESKLRTIDESIALGLKNPVEALAERAAPPHGPKGEERRSN